MCFNLVYFSALMPKFGNYIGFLLLIDPFCRNIWSQPLINKTKKEVTKKLALILASAGTFDKISSDGELQYLSGFLRRRHIFYSSRGKGKHVQFCEAFLRQGKSVLDVFALHLTF